MHYLELIPFLLNWSRNFAIVLIPWWRNRHVFMSIISVESFNKKNEIFCERVNRQSATSIEMYAGFLSYFFIASRTLCQRWSWSAWWNACLAMRLMDNNKMWFSSRCDAAKRMFIWRSRANADIYTIVSRPKNVCPTFTGVAINSTYTTCHGAASASPFAGSLDILLRCRSIARSKKTF